MTFWSALLLSGLMQAQPRAPIDGKALSSQPPVKPKPPPQASDDELAEAFEKAWAARPAEREVPPFRWQLKNVVDEVEMPGLQESNGIPVKLHEVRIKGDLRDVMEDVVDQFTRQGLYLEPVTKQPQLTAETQITALDWSRFISYTVLIKPDKRSGTCSVVLAEANLGLAAAMRQRAGALPDFAPVPPQAKNLLRGTANELQSLSFSVPMSEDAVKKWYAEEMKRRGYVEKEGGFERGTEEIRMSVRRNEGELVVLLLRHTAVK